MVRLHLQGQIIEKHHPHWLSFLNYYFFGVLLIAVGAVYLWEVAVLGLLIFVFGEVIRRATTFYLLDTGVARGYNFFSTSRKFTEYENIQNVEVSQTFIENLFGVGHVRFDTSGSHSFEIDFAAINDPYSIEKKVRSRMS